MEKLELNKRYTGLFCTCCGVKAELIWEDILKYGQPYAIGIKIKEHFVPQGRNYFYTTNPIMYCQECGKKLEFNDMKFEKQEIGECHGVIKFGYPTEYCCRSCGFVYG